MSAATLSIMSDHPHDSEELNPERYNIDELAQKEAELQAKLQKIQNYLHEAPVQHELEDIERNQTLPPPEEITERRREKEFFDRLTRGELKNERRHQAQNGVLFILLICAIATVCMWLYRYMQ